MVGSAINASPNTPRTTVEKAVHGLMHYAGFILALAALVVCVMLHQKLYATRIALSNQMIESAHQNALIQQLTLRIHHGASKDEKLLNTLENLAEGAIQKGSLRDATGMLQLMQFIDHDQDQVIRIQKRLSKKHQKAKTAAITILSESL